MLELKIEQDGEEYIFEEKTKDKLVNKAFQYFKDTFEDHSDVNINVVYCTSLMNDFRIEAEKKVIKQEIEKRIIDHLEGLKRQIEEEENYSESEKVGINESDF